MVIFYSEKFKEHEISHGHPESPMRLDAIRDALVAKDLWNDVIEPKDATPQELEKVHVKRYLKILNGDGNQHWTMDTQSHKNTFSIARLAAGASIMAAESAWNNRKPSIALVRPPGHHAVPDLAMGFCYLNNIAIAAKKLLDRTKKIAIVDIDVHHGNGTQDIFYDSPEVLYISTHQKWIFPGTGNFNEIGIGKGRGYTVNIPLNSEAGDASFLLAHEKIVLPVLQEFNPDIILVSLGTDSHYRDPLATLTLSSEGYSKEIDGLLGYAKKNCNNRIAFYLEGGYDLDALAEVISHTVGQFEGKNTPIKFDEIFDNEAFDRDSITAITQAHKEYWSI